MDNAELFLGPGNYLIEYQKPIVSFGYWYDKTTLQVIKKASYLEMYILSKYSICKPKIEGEWDITHYNAALYEKGWRP